MRGCALLSSGTVDGYRESGAQGVWWHIAYDDGDSEELDTEELVEHLIDGIGVGPHARRISALPADCVLCVQAVLPQTMKPLELSPTQSGGRRALPMAKVEARARAWGRCENRLHLLTNCG